MQDELFRSLKQAILPCKRLPLTRTWFMAATRSSSGMSRSAMMLSVASMLAGVFFSPEPSPLCPVNEVARSLTNSNIIKQKFHHLR